VTKKYHKAKTPYQRLMLSPHLTKTEKENLEKQYHKLDPIDLQNRLVKLQDNFWKHAWKAGTEDQTSDSTTTTRIIDNLMYSLVNDVKNVADINLNVEQPASIHPLPLGDIIQSSCNIRRYRKTDKPRKSLGPRTWRTREDAFINEWEKIKFQLELNPILTATSLLKQLIEEKPDEFKMNQLKTLQRRVSSWRLEQLKIHQEAQSQKCPIQEQSAALYVVLAANAVSTVVQSNHG
jgi:hypothetical protein